MKNRLMIFCAALCSALMAFAASRATTPMMKRDDWWVKRWNEHSKCEKTGQYDFVFIGDSIMHRWEYEPAGKEVWAAKLAKYRVFNCGYAADRTEHALARLESGEIDKIDPLVVFVHIGTNNAGQTKDKPEETAEGIKLILESIKLRAPHAKIMLMPIFLRGKDANDPARIINEKVNELIRPLADGKRIEWMDLRSLFANSDGTISPDMMKDYLHLTSVKAYNLWADALIKVMDKVLEDAKPILEFDFTEGIRQYDVDSKGSFHGVLPKNIGDNFSGWSVAHLTTELKEENGVKFLRFTASKAPNGGQFSGGTFAADCPGVFRCVIKARTENDSFSFGLRQHGAPYHSVWTTPFNEREFREYTYYFKVTEKQTQSVGFFFWPQANGYTDIASVKFYRAQESDLTTTVRRPAPSVTRYMHNVRFLLGLPCGWSVDRATYHGQVTVERQADGTPCLLAQNNEDENCVIYSAPFQTNRPDTPHNAALKYRAEGKWYFEVYDSNRRYISAAPLKECTEWNTAVSVFTPNATAEAFYLRIVGSGKLWLDCANVTLGKEPPREETECAVALAPVSGEIASVTRIQFTDEPALVKWCVRDAPAGATLKMRVADIYGARYELADIKLAAQKEQSGEVNFMPALAPKLGQFRIEAVVATADGKRAAEPVETVVTRLARPPAWGKDAPDSPFGAHFLAQEGMIKTMKAMGINHARFHDAHTELTGWAHLEPEKGKWNFAKSDWCIEALRKNNIWIFGQLGTAPAWATHYGDLGCKYMGYFERYLRPTNVVDWVNYVKTIVKRNEGRINEYFVWNEPWGGWWKSAADIKYYDADKAAYDFGVFQNITSQAAREVVPSVKICGYNTYASESGRDWTAGVDSAGAFATCDALDFHFYTTVRLCRRGMQSTVMHATFEPVLAAHANFDGKPVYMSEGQGTSNGGTSSREHLSGLYRLCVPWAAEARALYTDCADKTCRYLVEMMAEGVKRIYLYTAHGYTCLAVRPSFLTLIGADGFATPTSVAHSHMACRIEGKQFVRSTEYGKKAMAYLFADAQGNEVTMYSDLTSDEAMALAADKTLLVTDLFGNALNKTTYLPGSVVWASKR